MIYTIVKKNSYQDSINLMLLTNSISTIEGVNKAQIMMGTPANKDIFKTAGLYSDELETAESNDMAIVVDTDDENKMSEVLEKVEQYLKDQSKETPPRVPQNKLVLHVSYPILFDFRGSVMCSSFPNIEERV